MSSAPPPVTANHHLCCARSALEVRDSPGKGRGVFAVAPLSRGALLEESHVVLVDGAVYATHGTHTPLADYVFKWQRGGWALALGLGSLFNHARTPNVGWVRDYHRAVIRYTALRDIAAGEELCISYGRVWWDGGEEADSSSSGSSDAEADGRVWPPIAAIDVEALTAAAEGEAHRSGLRSG